MPWGVQAREVAAVKSMAMAIQVWSVDPQDSAGLQQALAMSKQRRRIMNMLNGHGSA